MPTRLGLILIICFALVIFHTPISTRADTKQPGDITGEEYEIMVSSSDGYKRCLQDKALSIIDDNSDPRHVVDAAMKQCVRILENLNVELEKRDFPQGFRTGYIRRITHRSVTQLLTNLMVLMSARQQK